MCVSWNHLKKHGHLYFAIKLFKLEAAVRRSYTKKVFLKPSQNSLKIACAGVSLLIKLHNPSQQHY